MKIIRTYENEVQTTGHCQVGDSRFYTLELAWNDNRRETSRIPAGRYKCQKRWSQTYGDHFHILDVPERSYILMHHGNFHRNTLGCVLVGLNLQDIDGDGQLDVTNSIEAMRQLNSLLPDEFNLEIIEEFKK